MEIIPNKLKYLKYIFGIIMFLGIFHSCKKDDYVGENPYEGAKEPLNIKLNTSRVVPDLGTPGETVELTGKGFSLYRDSGMVVKFNGVEGDILSATDSVLKVKIPNLASSGMITLTVLKEVFAGPFFRVKGAIQIDSPFHSLPGVTGGIINRVLFIPGGQFLIGGNFIDYGNSGYK